MNAVDTNVLVYSVDRNDPVKWNKARALLRQLRADATPTYLPWQVIGEFVRFLRAWQDQGQISRGDLDRYVIVFRRLYPLLMPTPRVLDFALDLTRRYSLSHWDSMLLGACLDSGITTLFTEDMGVPTTVDSIRLINPFI